MFRELHAMNRDPIGLRGFITILVVIFGSVLLMHIYATLKETNETQEAGR